ncbi:MAG TPA: LamG-like jellyroll fold domain-containing protein, partial [Bacteroidota bacterium]|nr:LamG-like jellyroll fold domain-containing protein [Bacteroidota bacterium]
LTRALWHFDESSGALVHDTAAGLDGTANGTTIVPGRFGNARAFNGVSDYVTVPSNTSFDFDTASFTVDVWFRTTQLNGVILRRGLAPEPGFMISTLHGHVVGMIGNRNDLPGPNALLSDTSIAAYADNLWHLATMVRNRTLRKLFLFVDGINACNPADDNFTIPLNSDRPLTIGEWENPDHAFFAGSIDEVRLSSPRLVRFPVKIDVQPGLLDFGTVRAFTRDTVGLQVANAGYRDSLRVTAISSSNPRFTVPPGPFAVRTGSTVVVPVVYAPTGSQVDTGTITLACNDPSSPTLSVRVSGRGFAPLDNPVITSIKRISYNQLRIVWIRSRFDTLIANPVEQYSIWRLIPLTGSTTPAMAQGGARPDSVLSPGSAWEFIQAVPAIGVDFYAYVMPSPTDYTGGNAWDVYEVVAQTRDLAAYASPTDSIAGLNVTGATGKAGTQIPGALTLNQNYPNPFNPSTTIRYGLPARSVVSLIVYNVLGQAVALLVDGEQESGYHEVRFDGSKLASGVYLCRLQAGSDVQTRKLLLLK